MPKVPNNQHVMSLNRLTGLFPLTNVDWLDCLCMRDSELGLAWRGVWLYQHPQKGSNSSNLVWKDRITFWSRFCLNADIYQNVVYKDDFSRQNCLKCSAATDIIYSELIGTKFKMMLLRRVGVDTCPRWDKRNRYAVAGACFGLKLVSNQLNGQR